MSLPNSSSGSTYGALAKVNYQNLPPADPTTDWDNTALAPAIEDVANLTQTAPRIIVRMTLATTTGALVLNNWFAVWQNATGTSPVLARTGTGVFTITLPTNVSDEYSQSLGNPSVIPVNLIAPIGNVIEGTTPGFVNVSCSTNVITVHTFNASGSANDLAGVVVNISVR